MKIDGVARQPQRGFSFAFFPPKADGGSRSPERSIEKLESRNSDFRFEKWGAGDSTRSRFDAPTNQ